MKTGSRGTFVISWSQTETDGIRAATPEMLAVGASWRWIGAPVRVDGPQSVLVLDAAENMADIRKRAARMVRRLIGASLSASLEERAAHLSAPDDADTDPEQGIVVTDGLQSWCVTLISVPDTGSTLAMFVDDLPPPTAICGWCGPRLTGRNPGQRRGRRPG